MSLDTDQDKKLFIVQVVCLVVLWFFIAPLRVWSLVSRKRGRSWKELPWVEDALMMAALVSQHTRHRGDGEVADYEQATLQFNGGFRLARDLERRHR